MSSQSDSGELISAKLDVADEAVSGGGERAVTARESFIGVSGILTQTPRADGGEHGLRMNLGFQTKVANPTPTEK